MVRSSRLVDWRPLAAEPALVRKPGFFIETGLLSLWI